MPSAPRKGAFVSLGRAENFVALTIPLPVAAVTRGSEVGRPEHRGRDRRAQRTLPVGPCCLAAGSPAAWA
jgi:hypothetical protein